MEKIGNVKKYLFSKYQQKYNVSHGMIDKIIRGERNPFYADELRSHYTGVTAQVKNVIDNSFTL